MVLSAVVALVGVTAVLAQAAPTLSATRGNGYVDLSWGGNTNATVYRVNGSCPGSNLTNVIQSSVTAPYRDSGLTNGQTYCYQIAVSSSFSNQVAATPGVGFSPATPDPTFGATPDQNKLPQSVNDILRFFSGLATWFFVGLMLIVTFLVLYGAFLFLTSQGNPEKTQQARGLLLWVAIGIIVAALAWVFPRIVQNFVGVGQ